MLPAANSQEVRWCLLPSLTLIPRLGPLLLAGVEVEWGASPSTVSWPLLPYWIESPKSLAGSP